MLDYQHIGPILLYKLLLSGQREHKRDEEECFTIRISAPGAELEWVVQMIRKGVGSTPVMLSVVVLHGPEQQQS